MAMNMDQKKNEDVHMDTKKPYRLRKNQRFVWIKTS